MRNQRGEAERIERFGAGEATAPRAPRSRADTLEASCDVQAWSRGCWRWSFVEGRGSRRSSKTTAWLLTGLSRLGAVYVNSLRASCLEACSEIGAVNACPTVGDRRSGAGSKTKASFRRVPGAVRRQISERASYFGSARDAVARGAAIGDHDCFDYRRATTRRGSAADQNSRIAYPGHSVALAATM